ncbi:MAG: hypothetical protein IPJ04_04750 [Candidatus Eisenbacteria bacterium]|nr:hypothetical protein [Candidatus Eisenbacteria bacterium]
MCSRVTCPKCKRPTWTGCGMHIEEALAGVPVDQRCDCREKAKAEKAAKGGSDGGWLSKLMGR